MNFLDILGRIIASLTRNRAVRHSAFILFLGILCLLLPAKSQAQSSNRWLLVYNTSSAMRDRAPGVQAITQDLLSSGIHGALRPGDTIGIWTYNNELHAEEAPLQVWSPQTAPTIAHNTVQFLGNHPYQKTAAFGEVLGNMLRIVKMSDVITVILFSDGSDAVLGTPFDDTINSSYKTNFQKQKKAHMPVVTVFRGEKGTLTTNTISFGPWPVDIPMVPPPPVIVPAVVVPPPVVPAPKPVPSLVIIGKKAESTFNLPADLPDHSGDPNPAPAVAPAPAPAPIPVVATPEPTPAAKIEAQPAPIVPAAVTTPPTVAEAPKPIPAAPPVVAAVQSNEPAPRAVPASTPPAVETAVAAPGPILFSGRNIGIFSVAFTLIVWFVVLLNVRTARKNARASLITRSLDLDKK